MAVAIPLKLVYTPADANVTAIHDYQVPSTRRSTPRHPIAMASTAKPPDPMPCALAAILLPESSAPACHMRKTLFPGTFWVHAGCGYVRAAPACGVRRCGVGAPRESR